MRIMQLAQKPQRRGAEVFAYQLAQQLRRLQHHVRNVYLYPYEGERALPLLEGDVVLNGNETDFREKAPGIHPALLGRLTDVIRSFAPDVVQVNGARSIKYGAFAKRQARSGRWACIYRNIDNPAYWVRDPLRRAFYRWLVMPQMDGIIGVSEATLAEVRTMYKPKVPSIYIPNGVDLAPLRVALGKSEVRAQLQVNDETRIVLFVGNLTEQKRPDRFLRMFQQVNAQFPTTEGWLLGDGPLRGALEIQARDLGIASTTRFFGYQEQIAPYLAAADLMVVSSDSDGIPAVILEAGMMGLPVVAMRVGGIPECVRDGETGLLVAAGDEAALVHAVATLLQDSERRERLGRQAHTWVEANFGMEVIADRYLTFYQDVIVGNGNGSA